MINAWARYSTFWSPKRGKFSRVGPNLCHASLLQLRCNCNTFTFQMRRLGLYGTFQDHEHGCSWEDCSIPPSKDSLLAIRLHETYTHLRLCCRAKTIALVSKAFSATEQRHPVSFTNLAITAKPCNASFLTWHLRSCSRLVHLTLDDSPDFTMELYSMVFGLLASHAPALRSLTFSPPENTEGWGITK